MFTAKNVVPDEMISSVRGKVSEYDIFSKYCKNFEEINKSFLSEFYIDTTPSCRVYQNKDNALYYKDFGTGDNLSAYDYVMKKFGCTYAEALRIIGNDFGLFKADTEIDPKMIIGKLGKTKKKYVKPVISIVPRQWSLYDYNYWYKKFGISFEWLDSYNVIPCSYVYLHKNGETIAFEGTNSNPIYAYRFEHEGKYSYKIYKPLERNKKFKWLFSGGVSENTEGFDQLPLFDDLLILTKSLKDVICCRLYDYSAISLQGESNKLEKKLANKLLKRFKKVILLYDNDKAGKYAASKISEQYGFKSIFIPMNYGCKDLSELIAQEGLEVAKKILNKLIKNEDMAL